MAQTPNFKILSTKIGRTGEARAGRVEPSLARGHRRYTRIVVIIISINIIIIVNVIIIVISNIIIFIICVGCSCRSYTSSAVISLLRVSANADAHLAYRIICNCNNLLFVEYTVHTRRPARAPTLSSLLHATVTHARNHESGISAAAVWFRG